MFHRLVSLTALCFSIGVIWAYQLPILPSPIIVCLLTIMVIRCTVAYVPPCAVLGIGSGILWVSLAASYQLFEQLPVLTNQNSEEITFAINGVRSDMNYAVRYDVALLDRSQRIYLYHYQTDSDLALYHCYRAIVRLKPNRALGNPHTIKQDAYAWAKHRLMRGYIIRESQIVPIACPWRMQLNQRLYASLTARYPDSTVRALAQALLLGNTSGLSSDDWEILSRTGTAHLIAVSGLHLGLIALMIFGVTACLCRPLVLVFRCVPIMLISGCVACLVTGLYVWLIGLPISAVRAWVMMVMMWVLLCLRLRLHPYALLLITLAAVLLLFPLSGLGVGLWLSLGAVFMLIALSQRMRRWYQAWRLPIVLLPLSAVLLKGSVMAPWVNMIAVPIVSFVVLPGLIVDQFFPSLHLYHYLGMVMAAGWQALAWCAQYIPSFHWSVRGAQWFVLIVLMIVLILPWRVTGMLRIVCLVSVFIFPRPVWPENNTLELHALDVGQGSAIWLRFGRHSLLFDVGHPHVADFLYHYHISEIDRLIISHKDWDHRAGVDALLDKIKVNQIDIGEPIHELLNLVPQSCLAGQAWDWDGQVFFEYIYPFERGLSGNDASCVLKVTYGESTVLLTGDISKKAERQLVEAYEPFETSVLLSPHHGSKTSSSDAFIQHFSPQTVIHQTGYLNRYHHPHPDIVARYHRHSVTQYDNAQDGWVYVKLKPSGEATVSRFRERYRRWWIR